MARKSKKVAKDTTINGNQNVGYAGHITVDIMRGNRVISSKQYHNSGMPNLFKFLATSLAGETTDNLRPVKIKLFKYPGADSTLDNQKPNNFSWYKAWTLNTKLKPVQVSPFILFDVTPVIEKVKNEGAEEDIEDNYHYTSTLHFRIPFSYISDTTIHMIGLYPNNAVDPNIDVSAYYLFTDEEDPTAWGPLVLDDAAGNYSIVVKWTMALTNKI